MKTSLLPQLCKSIRAPATAKRYGDAGIGLLFILFNQLLVVPTQIALDLHSINLPASILVMLLVSLMMIIASCASGAVASFYTQYLRGPTDFLGRHMSFAFVASFVLLNRDHISNALDSPRIAGAFVITTLASYIAAFLFASGGFRVEYRIRGLRRKSDDVECLNKTWPSLSTPRPAPLSERSSQRISQLSSLSIMLGKNGSLTSIGTPTTGLVSITRSLDFIVRTGPIWISVLLLVLVGLPVYFASRYEMPFEALCFVLLWAVSVQLQRSLRASYRLLQCPRLRSIVIIFANPVVVASALVSVYLWVKSAYTGQTIEHVVSAFRRHNTLAECIVNIAKDSNFAAHLGAGDLAAPVLDAGIVCLGFKMFEYRRELWNSIATVFVACTMLAVMNVFVNVLVARAMGLQSSDAIAFAARSATIALGLPAVQNLDGNTALMGAIAIFSGIIYQMVGDWLFSLMRINDRRSVHQEKLGRNAEDSNSDTEKGKKDGVTQVKGREISAEANRKSKKAAERNLSEESAIVAAGVTVGINAAAMGTAHLIERDSRATAYSALSMTVFGAMTVALTTLPGVAEAVVILTSR